MITLKRYIIESSQELNAFVILKPGFTEHENDWLNMLRNNGWQIIQHKKIKLTHDQAEELYSMHKDKKFYSELCDYMCSDDCVCCTCHKDTDDAIAQMKKLKDRVRDVWGIDDMRNAMHSSDSIENVNRESKIIFG